MATATSAVLQRLHRVDMRIRDARGRVDSCDPQLSEVGAVVEQLETQAETTSGRVGELRAEERRLQRSLNDKRLRVAKIEDRLRSVRTVREEAAVQAELGLVRRLLDSEEQEAMNLLEQIERLEARLSDQQAELEEARDAAEPRRQQILADKEAAEREFAGLEEERRAVAATVDQDWLKVYDSLVKSGRKSAVASMLEDGACGACYSVIPLQRQHDIRAAADPAEDSAGVDAGPVTCEACGVIVTAPKSDASGQDPADASPLPGEVAELPERDDAGDHEAVAPEA